MAYNENLTVSYFAIRAVVGAGLVLLLSTVMSCREMRYALFAKQATATVYKVYEERPTPREERRGRSTMMVAMYKWMEPGAGSAEDGQPGERTDGIREEDVSSFKPGDTFEIDYLWDASRMKGDVQWRWPGILLGALVIGLLAATPLIMEAWQVGHSSASSGNSKSRSR